MPIETTLRQACLLHYPADSAGVGAELAKRTGRPVENLLVILRFVFR
jgi:hypothetical protein